jgi:hypothetical protein
MESVEVLLDVVTPVIFIGAQSKAYYPDRFGWYYRGSHDQYEFWWQGSEPRITLSAIIVRELLPEIVTEEIVSGVELKGDDGIL